MRQTLNLVDHSNNVHTIGSVRSMAQPPCTPHAVQLLWTKRRTVAARCML